MSDDIRITTYMVGDLPSELRARWCDLQRSDERFGSPYFHPTFTECVAAVRSDVEVAVLTRGDDVVGVLPFQRTIRNHGRPVGGRLNDYHGMVLEDDVRIDASDVVSGCRLASWSFANVLAEQTAFAGHVETSEPAPFVDLAEGFEAFERERREAGSNRLKRIAKKSRQLGRDVGPLRYEHDVTDPEVLSTLIDWKSTQYRKTGLTDVFARSWTVDVLRSIHERRDDDFRGRLSTLHAGDRLVAIEFGMRTETVYHSWFPAYDPELSKFSPGGVLFVDILRSLAGDGVRRVDLGAGLENGKESFASGSVPVGRGSVFVDPVARFLHEAGRAAKRLVKSSPLGFTKHLVRPLREWMEFR